MTFGIAIAFWILACAWPIKVLWEIHQRYRNF
jgi:hypothetical protein